MLQVGVMVRTIVVTAFKQNNGQNGADEKYNAKCTNENEEPRFIYAQVGISWELYIFNMVGIDSPERGFAHKSCEAWLRMIISG